MSSQFNQNFNPQKMSPNDPMSFTQSEEPMGPPNLHDGPPSMGTTYEALDDFGRPPSQGINKLYLGIGLASFALIAFGAVRGVLPSEPKEPVARPQIETIWTQQQNMMRDAMQMAREAQALQRERMDMMDREIQMAEFGYVPDEEGR